MSDSGVRRTAVIDTNLFVSGTIFKRGKPFALLEAWRAQAFPLLLSETQYDELVDVFSRPSIVARYELTPEEIGELFAGLSAAPRVEPSPTLPLDLRDHDDEHILAAALGGKADYLVTGDNDLLVFAGDPRLGTLRIVTVSDFLAILDHLHGKDEEEAETAEEGNE